MGLKSTAKRIARIVLGEYSAYYIYASPNEHSGEPSHPEFRVRQIDASDIGSCGDDLIREQAFYAGNGAKAYGCYVGDSIAGVCFYWYGDRYLKRNFWPLRPDEAKLVQIITVPRMQGRGVATTLIAASCRDMLEKGFRRSFARIWHSNTPSLRAFARAGWSRIALVVEINPLGRTRLFRICLPMARRKSDSDITRKAPGENASP